jgi:hypothetical protein
VKQHRSNGLPAVGSSSLGFWLHKLIFDLWGLDIVALLIIGVLLVGVFISWQWYLEKTQNKRLDRKDEEKQEGNRTWDNRLPPPLMKLSLWARAKGRFTAVMAIALLTWSSFIAWTFWVQVRFSFLFYAFL